MLIDLDVVNPSNARDVLAAVPDAMSMALGSHIVRTPHPFADWAAESPLKAAAYSAGLLLNPRQPGESQNAVLSRGIRTLDFGKAVAGGLEAAARRLFDLQAQHIPAVAKVEVTRLGMPEPVGAMDLTTPFTDVGDGLEYGISNAQLRDGESVTLSSIGRLIGVSRETVMNDDLNLLEAAIAATGVAAARHEARLVAAALEANGNLSDGLPVFDSSFGNLSTAGSVLSSSTLQAALTALREMPAADGEALDAAPAWLIVAPVAEIAARQVLFASGLTNIGVLVLPGIAADRFYVSASPDVARTVAVGRLAGAAHPLAIESVKTPLSYDGVFLRVRVETSAAMIGRLGIVKVTDPAV